MPKRILSYLGTRFAGKRARKRSSAEEAGSVLFDVHTVERFPVDSSLVEVSLLSGGSERKPFMAVMAHVLSLRFGEEIAHYIMQPDSAFYKRDASMLKACRFKDILPPVATLLTAAGEPVNANSIFLNGTLRGIATQAPTHESASNFWNMVVENDVRVVVDLTTEKDKGIRNIPPYKEEKFLKASGTGIEKTSVAPYSDSGYSAEVLQRKTLAGDMVYIHALNFKMWPDFGALSIAGLHNVVSQITRAQKEVGGNVAIHCTAGVGRSGAVFSAMLLAEMCENGMLTQRNYADKVLETIADGRFCRGMHFVQTRSQVRMLFDYAEWLLKQGDRYGGVS